MSYRYESIYFDDPIRPGRVLDIFQPEKTDRNIALFFVHGGGWLGGSRTCFHKIMRGFNAKGFICASTDYTLDGADIWRQITDLRTGYMIFQKELKKLGLDGSCVMVLGSSAGAHLAGLLALTKPGECGENAKLLNELSEERWIPPVGAALQAAPVLFEPWRNIFPPSWECFRNITGLPYEGNEEKYAKLAHMNHIKQNSPPMFHLCAENEHMFPIRYIKEFKKRMIEAGARCETKTYEDAEHGFFYDLTRDVQKVAFNDILDFATSLES